MGKVHFADQKYTVTVLQYYTGWIHRGPKMIKFNCFGFFFVMNIKKKEMTCGSYISITL